MRAVMVPETEFTLLFLSLFSHHLAPDWDTVAGSSWLSLLAERPWKRSPGNWKVLRRSQRGSRALLHKILYEHLGSLLNSSCLDLTLAAFEGFWELKCELDQHTGPRLTTEWCGVHVRQIQIALWRLWGVNDIQIISNGGGFKITARVTVKDKLFNIICGILRLPA